MVRTVGSYALSGNGRYLVFWTGQEYDGTSPDLLIRDLDANSTTTPINVGTDGSRLPGDSFGASCWGPDFDTVCVSAASFVPTISDDGRYVAFLYGGVVNVRDREGGQTTSIPHPAPGDLVTDPLLSNDGSAVLYENTVDPYLPGERLV